MIAIRPQGVDCPKWEPTKDHPKRCAHYEAATHGCGHPLIGGVECSEYTKLKTKQAAASALPSSKPEPPRTALFADMADVAFGGVGRHGGGSLAGGAAVAQQGAKARPKAEPGPSGSGSGSGASRPNVHRVIAGAIELGLLPPPEFEAAKEIDPKSIEALEASVESIEMSSASMGGKTIVLTRKVDPTDPRLQISFRDAATIRLLVDCFPGAQVIDVRRRDEAEVEP